MEDIVEPLDPEVSLLMPTHPPSSSSKVTESVLAADSTAPLQPNEGESSYFPSSPISTIISGSSASERRTSRFLPDLDMAWKTIQRDSRYAYAAPPPEKVLSYLKSRSNQRTATSSRATDSTSSTTATESETNPPTNLLGSSHSLSTEFSTRSAAPINLRIKSFNLVDISETMASLSLKFGFQKDVAECAKEYLQSLLDSRVSRQLEASLIQTQEMALSSLFRDYVCGSNSNFRKWLFVDGDPLVELSNIAPNNISEVDDVTTQESRWALSMETLPPNMKARKLALFILIWVEASNVRFMPEFLAYIYYLANEYDSANEEPCGKCFLENCIIPIYQFLRVQNWKIIGNRLIPKEKDHANIVGYDDVNEFFHSKVNLESLTLKQEPKQTLVSVPLGVRYTQLCNVNWKIRKSFYEYRTFVHILSNFSRIWILHLAFFFSYFAWVMGPILFRDIAILDAIEAFNATKTLTASLSSSMESKLYARALQSNTPDSNRINLKTFDISAASTLRLALLGAGPVLAVLFAMICVIMDTCFFPCSKTRSCHTSTKLLLLVALMVLNASPLAFVVGFGKLNGRKGLIGIACVVWILVVGILTVAYLVVVPVGIRESKMSKNTGWRKVFVGNIAPLKPLESWLSIGIWFLVFLSKFVESLFFIALPSGRPLLVLLRVPAALCREAALICRITSLSAAVLLFLTVLILFFLDTYMWWIVWSTGLGAIRVIFSGLSVLTPWRNIFSRLPERIHAKLLNTRDMAIKLKNKVLCSQVWNAIVISLTQDHLLSLDHVDKLLYKQHLKESDPDEGERIVIEKPRFFAAQEDASTKLEYFPSRSEAERRITFFAQSLSMTFPEPESVERMPSFSVLIPHFNEKILLNLREVLKQTDSNSSLTLLEYLKSLHSFEWSNFVKDTKLICSTNSAAFPNTLSSPHELSLNTVGFYSSTGLGRLRTRIWASLRTQTLYRCVSGMMNYPKALRLLLQVENRKLQACNLFLNLVALLVKSYKGDHHALRLELEKVVQNKFTCVIAMQNYARFSPEEIENVEILLKIHPDLRIGYIEHVNPDEAYSCLIDGYCAIADDGRRVPKFRIKLPGYPILGDGKSDNQNTNLIYTKGEFLQLVDANQDHYFEETLKIRNLLQEFVADESSESQRPVSIVGAREHIFSERFGVLGDVAAGKEYCFGTIAQRVTSKLGARLHYGHPDFLNVVFITTRGGVSKAQKTLSVNEDIYAGMNALLRGGRIIHTEYLQCGKGRDLGFSSILKFVAKIGAGMAEQMLSREHNYLGNNLPLDRLLTFYYGHPGFHVNNIFIMFSLQLMVLLLLCLTALRLFFTECSVEMSLNALYLSTKAEKCVHLNSVFDWMKQAIFSIVAVFAITVLPLFTQLFAEQGLMVALGRIVKHIVSFSPLFDAFTTQIYAYTLLYDLCYGRAGYISSGRSVATARASFSTLYQAFAEPSIYLGMRLFLILAAASSVAGFPHLAFFWIMVLPLCIAPFFFNPHQFRISDFLKDYWHILRWFTCGNNVQDVEGHVTGCWIHFQRNVRCQLTGNKYHKEGERAQSGYTRAKCSTILLQELIVPFILAVIAVAAYGASFPSLKRSLAIVGISLVPVIINLVFLLVVFPISLIFGSAASMAGLKRCGNTIAGILHGISVFGVFITYIAIAMLSYASLGRTLVGIIAVTHVQRILFRLMAVFMLTREMESPLTNIAWWNGVWCMPGLGWSGMVLPFRELICKLIEMSAFSADFIIVHVILMMLFPLCLIPYVDSVHTLMLLWATPTSTVGKANQPILSPRQKKIQRLEVWKAAITFSVVVFSSLVVFVAPLIVPVPATVGKLLNKYLP